MRLIEFFTILNEQRSFSIREKTDGIAGVYARRGASFPSYIFKPLDSTSLKNSRSIAAIALQPRKLERLRKILVNKKFVDRNINPAEESLLDFVESVRLLQIDPSQLRRIENLPASLYRLQGEDRIFKFVTTDLGIPMVVYHRLFGVPPKEVEETHFIPFHNARLFLPDKMTKRSRDAAIDTLETVYQHLAHFGESDVFGGDIRFIRMRADGTYDLEHGVIVIDPNINKTGKTVYSLLHEYGHKRMYEMMTEEEVNEIRKKYNDLMKSGERYKGDPEEDSIIKRVLEKLKPGTRVRYMGRRKDLKKNPNYSVVGVGEHKGKMVAALAYEREWPTSRVAAMAYLHNLANPKKWKVEGLDVRKKEYYEQEFSSDWFPTRYSQTVWYEWWAELYAFYVLGRLSGEPADWMKKMIGETAEETVGSNAGEISSEDDVPWPGPAHGDEEGNASWEWTDPYHQSGAENAVMSGTP